jgi:hypothetical protein
MSRGSQVALPLCLFYDALLIEDHVPRHDSRVSYPLGLVTVQYIRSPLSLSFCAQNPYTNDSPVKPFIGTVTAHLDSHLPLQEY